jgi:hypothetical protein
VCWLAIHWNLFVCDVNVYQQTAVDQLTPGFHYSYQCSFALISNYTYVFCFRYILSGLVEPWLSWRLLKWCTDWKVLRLLPKRFSVERLSSVWMLLLLLLLTQSSSPSAGNDRHLAAVERVLSRRGKLRQRQVVRWVTDFAMLLCFGGLFPPLACVIFVSMWKDMLELKCGLYRLQQCIAIMSAATSASQEVVVRHIDGGKRTSDCPALSSLAGTGLPAWPDVEEQEQEQERDANEDEDNSNNHNNNNNHKHNNNNNNNHNNNNNDNDNNNNSINNQEKEKQAELSLAARLQRAQSQIEVELLEALPVVWSGLRYAVLISASIWAYVLFDTTSASQDGGGVQQSVWVVVLMLSGPLVVCGGKVWWDWRPKGSESSEGEVGINEEDTGNSDSISISISNNKAHKDDQKAESSRASVVEMVRVVQNPLRNVDENAED